MNMSRLRFAALMILFVWAWPRLADSQPQSESCAVCHLAMGVEHLTKPAELYKADIHAAKGFGCVACHGGDGTIGGMEAMRRQAKHDRKASSRSRVDVWRHPPDWRHLHPQSGARDQRLSLHAAQRARHYRVPQREHLCAPPLQRPRP